MTAMRCCWMLGCCSETRGFGQSGLAFDGMARMRKQEVFVIVSNTRRASALCPPKPHLLSFPPQGGGLLRRGSNVIIDYYPIIEFCTMARR